MRDAEEFWDELLAQIEDGQVIPVVGPELLTLRIDGRDTPLYEALAQRLLAKYGLHVRIGAANDASGNGDRVVDLRPRHELNDAVCAVARRGRRVQDLYRPVCELLKSLLDASHPDALQPLRDLASVSAFKLFVSTTPDDLLARAINDVRHGGLAKVEHIVFAPKLASGTTSDLPEMRSTGYCGVCYLFGKASPSPFVFAIHDEDTLEFIHTLQINGAESMKVMFSQLRTQNLLLVGCNFADWLSRLFIRLANTARLADNRSKHEFLVDSSTEHEGSLTLFLERFSPDTWVLPGNAREFTSELARRWLARHPQAEPQPAETTAAAQARARSDESIFISYSRTDVAAARAILTGLQDIGADVVWFDKGTLTPGDDFEQKIRNAINACWLFLPLISATTETREEGFFREEWMLASERVRRIQGRKFIVPVVVDADYDGNAGRYRLVNQSFLGTHFGHAPDGAMSDELRAELTRLIRERRGGGPT